LHFCGPSLSKWSLQQIQLHFCISFLREEIDLKEKNLQQKPGLKASEKAGLIELRTVCESLVQQFEFDRHLLTQEQARDATRLQRLSEELFGVFLASSNKARADLSMADKRALRRSKEFLYFGVGQACGDQF
jgi:hypothetical protein